MKKTVCLFIILTFLFLVSCGETISPTGTTMMTVTTSTSEINPIEEPKKNVTFYASALHHAALESPSRILLFQGGALWYYSKADGESYMFCFNPLCQHTRKENCVARLFNSHTSRKDLCIYSEEYNRFYFARGQNIYSTSFDASDLKLECSFGETGALDQINYPANLSILRLYNDYIYFRSANSDTGKKQIVRYNITTHKVEEMTSAEDEWVLGYEIADGYIYYKTIDNDNNIRYYTTDMDFKERKSVTNPIYFENPGFSMGLYDGKYFYDEIANGKELYRLNPLTNEKELIAKDERLIGSANMICVKENEGVYVLADDIYVLGSIDDDILGSHDVSTVQNSIYKVSFDGEFTEVLYMPRGDIDTMNFIDNGVIILFNRIFHKEINVENPSYVGSVFVLFEIDENGNFVNPKPIGNNADNEELIEFFNGDWQ